MKNTPECYRETLKSRPYSARCPWRGRGTARHGVAVCACSGSLLPGLPAQPAFRLLNPPRCGHLGRLSDALPRRMGWAVEPGDPDRPGDSSSTHCRAEWQSQNSRRPLTPLFDLALWLSVLEVAIGCPFRPGVPSQQEGWGRLSSRQGTWAQTPTPPSWLHKLREKVPPLQPPSLRL